MGRASSNKKVSRAASTGGGRTARGRTPILWYSTLFLAVALGVFVVFTSASDLREIAADDTPPRMAKDGRPADHWHAAYGFYICDAWVPTEGLVDKHRDRYGIHSHGDGLIHAHPAVPSAAGKNANLAKFFEELDIEVDATSISLPKSSGAKRLEVKNGDKCGTVTGRVKAVVFKNQADSKGEELKGNPSDWRIEDGTIIAIGFVPSETELQHPPSVANLAEPSDVPSSSQSPPPVPTPAQGSTPPPEGTPTTAASGTTAP